MIPYFSTLALKSPKKGALLDADTTFELERWDNGGHRAGVGDSAARESDDRRRLEAPRLGGDRGGTCSGRGSGSSDSGSAAAGPPRRRRRGRLDLIPRRSTAEPIGARPANGSLARRHRDRATQQFRTSIARSVLISPAFHPSLIERIPIAESRKISPLCFESYASCAPPGPG